MQTLIRRARADTPPFFKKLRNIAAATAAIATALLTAPVTLPVAVTTAAGYLVTAGTVATLISQLTINDPPKSGAKKKARKGGNHVEQLKP